MKMIIFFLLKVGCSWSLIHEMNIEKIVWIVVRLVVCVLIQICVRITRHLRFNFNSNHFHSESFKCSALNSYRYLWPHMTNKYQSQYWHLFEYLISILISEWAILSALITYLCSCSIRSAKNRRGGKTNHKLLPNDDNWISVNVHWHSFNEGDKRVEAKKEYLQLSKSSINTFVFEG